jgi:hypothetical protein
MRSIRKFAYAAVLTASMFTIQPTLASAEDAHGVFTLTHEVHWQNRVLRPGDYAFTLSNSGRPTFLTLRGLNGTGTDAVVLVMDFEPSSPDDSTRLVLVSRDGESFVSAMDLPDFDMSLRFDVPRDKAPK